MFEDLDLKEHEYMSKEFKQEKALVIAEHTEGGHQKSCTRQEKGPDVG